MTDEPVDVNRPSSFNAIDADVDPAARRRETTRPSGLKASAVTLLPGSTFHRKPSFRPAASTRKSHPNSYAPAATNSRIRCRKRAKGSRSNFPVIDQRLSRRRAGQVDSDQLPALLAPVERQRRGPALSVDGNGAWRSPVGERRSGAGDRAGITLADVSGDLARRLRRRDDYRRRPCAMAALLMSSASTASPTMPPAASRRRNRPSSRTTAAPPMRVAESARIAGGCGPLPSFCVDRREERQAGFRRQGPKDEAAVRAADQYAG